MIKPTVTVDKRAAATLNANLKELLKVTREPARKVITQQAGLFAKNAAFATDRYGFNKSIKAKHDIDIEKSINTIYKDASDYIEKFRSQFGDKVANNFQRAVRSGNVTKVDEIMSRLYKRKFHVIRWDGGALHKQWKKNPRSRPRAILVGGKNDKKSYITKQKKMVGNAKSGWARAHEQIKPGGAWPRGWPAWTRKNHFKAKGIGRVTGNGDKTIATVGNLAPYGMKISAIKHALRETAFNIKRQYIYIINAQNKACTRASNAGKRFGMKVGRII